MQSMFKKMLTIALLSALPVLAQAGPQNFKIDATELTQELQKTSHQEGIKLAWWIADEYWVAYSKKPGDMDALLKALKPYILIAVLDGKVSPLGAVSYKTEEDVRNGAKIFDATGNPYTPIDAKDVSPEASKVLEIIKPIIGNALGQMGHNMVFMVFPRKDQDGKPIVVPTDTGRFKIELGGEDFTYRLPLAALSPRLKCKNDPELFPSTYKYCPYDGTPLVPQTPELSGK